MLYQLPDGRTVEISLDDYLNLDHAGIQNLMANKYYGAEIRNPFFKSASDSRGDSYLEKEELGFDEDDFETKDVSEIPSEFKMLDQDFDEDNED